MSNYFWYLGIAPPHGAAIGEAVRGSRRVVHSTTTEQGGVLVVVFCISSCQSFDVFFSVRCALVGWCGGGGGA